MKSSGTEVGLEVVSLHIYPVKSCGGIDLDEFKVGERGPQFDREWMWVDSTQRFITQRQHPGMALIGVALTADHLVLTAPGQAPLHVELHASARAQISVEVWGDTCQAFDEGDETLKWMKSAAGIDARLVRMAPRFERKLPEKYGRPTSHTGFADTMPFLLTTQESLDDLNCRLTEKVPMNRFRPNIVVKGGSAYAEDKWKLIQLGAVELDLARDCTRCAITTIDQTTAKAGKEPLKTLASYRRDGTRIKFGQNAIHLNQGILKVGDKGFVRTLK